MSKPKKAPKKRAAKKTTKGKRRAPSAALMASQESRSRDSASAQKAIASATRSVLRVSTKVRGSERAALEKLARTVGLALANAEG